VFRHSADLRFGVGLKLCRKSEGLAYENAENQYPRRTIRQKIRPSGVLTPNSKRLTEALLVILRNDPLCVEWDVLPYTVSQSSHGKVTNDHR